MSTLATQSRRLSVGLLALITSFLVVLSGLFVAPAAYAADVPTPAITVTPSENLDPAADNVLTVSGTGFVGAGAVNGTYLVVVDKTIWSGEAPLVSREAILQSWVKPHQIVDGAFTTTFTIPANSLDPTKEYHVGSSAAHELSLTDRSLDAFANLSVAQPAPVAQATATTLAVSANSVEEGADVTLTATVAPVAEGTVSFTAGGSPLGAAQQVSAGVATLTTSALAVGTHQIEANFSPTDAGAFAASTSDLVSVTVTAPEATGPADTTLTVSPHASSVSDGHRVGLTAKLTSSVPNTGAAALAIGKVQFFENGIGLGEPVTASLPKTSGSLGTVTNVSGPVVAGQDSVFTATFTPTNANAHNSAESAPATVAGTASTGRWDAKIEVFLKTGETLVPYTDQKLYEGDQVVVRGTGFDPEASVGGRGVPLPFGPQGAYVVFGNFDSTGWAPSATKPSTTRKVSGNNQGWVLSQTVFDSTPAQYQPAVRAQWVKPAFDGSFEWTTTLETPELAANGKFGIYTYAAGGATNADEELEVLVNYVDEVRPDSPDIELAVGGLDWAFNTSWNGYAKYGAQATIAGTNGATVDAAGLANYTQVKGGDFDAKTSVGSIHYQGTVSYVSELHGFDIAIKDPQITFTSKMTATLTAEVSDSDTDGASKMTRITFATLTADASTEGADGVLNWADVQGMFADPIQPEGWAQYAGKASAPLNFSYGAEKSDIPVDLVVPPTKPNNPVKPAPAPKPASNSPQAGSLSWGISQGYKEYTTGNIAKGSVSLNGAGLSGGAYLFPQANGGAWNKEAQTGSVHFSGVVTFSGHGGLMTETFANPVITVSSATSGTLSVGGRTFGLNLGAASKTVGANGEVTWGGVPVSGTISGGGASGGGAGGGSFSPDPLTFTVGSASGVQFGSTMLSNEKADREAAATAPATTGIDMVTPADELVPGGEIEFTSSGFETSERDILVVVYSDPIVLDRKAGANANGEVRWIGTLPEDLEPGTHTITLQGSKDTGAIIEVLDPNETAAVTTAELSTTGATAEPSTAGTMAGLDAGPVWLWWIGAGALIALACATGGLLVHQRRVAAAATVNDGAAV